MHQLCVFCGIERATTRDHIPPKGIFVRPRPNNLITVPASEKCNGGSSALDERFIADLGIHVSNGTRAGKRLFAEQVMITLRHNNKLSRKVTGRIKPINFTTPEGTICGRGHIGEWDKEPHMKIIEKTIRGLYYHHYNQILDANYSVDTYFFDSLTEELQEISENWAFNSFGDGDVIYKYTRAEENEETSSVWLFQFYGSHWAGGQTKKSGPVNFKKKPS